MLLAITISIFFARFLFPSDGSFLGDEANFLQMAQDLNQQGVWATHSLVGSAQIAYGPFAIWFYQTALYFTHNLVLISMMKNALTVVAVAWSARVVFDVLGISTRSDRLRYLLLLLLSPYLWFYGRDLWDNSLLVPLSALTIACYLRFCQKPDLLPLSLAIGFAVSAALTHLMSLSFIVGITLHLCIYFRPWLRKNWLKLIPDLFFSLLMAWPYLEYVTQNSGAALSIGIPTTIDWKKTVLGSLQGFANPLLAPRYFSFVGFDYLAGLGWWIPKSSDLFSWRLFVPAFYAATFLVFVPVYAGFIQSCRTLRASRPNFIASLAIFIFLSHWAISTVRGLADFPHYLNAVWFVVFIFCMQGCLWGVKYALFRKALGVYLTASLFCFSFYVVRLHTHHGTRFNQHGPTLGNKLAIAEELAKFPTNSEVQLADGVKPESTLGTLLVLRKALYPESPAGTPPGRFTIRYAKPVALDDGQVVLERLAP